MHFMTRTFIPVGQGAFYLEQFGRNPERINVVYDCGSNTDVDLVKKQIDDAFDPGETIHAVFLSHLHEDHMNGLEHLLTRCQVKRLFFPLLTKEFKILLQLKYLSSGKIDEKSFFMRFIEDPKSALEDYFKDHNLDYPLTLHPVISNQPRDDYKRELSEQNTDELGKIPLEPVKSGQSVSPMIDRKYIKEWLYIPFNFREEKRSKILKEKLFQIFGYSCSPEDLLDACKKNPSVIDKIKEAYKAVPGNFNTNSLVLFSGCKDRKMIQYLACDRCWHTHCPRSHCLPSGCLYTGDYEAKGKLKWMELDSAYEDYYDYIGCLQIPHHGSRYNFNVNFLYFPFCELYIASAGYRNKHHHPHGSVIRDILAHGKHLMIVNEYPGSAVYLYVRYR